jgi:hypothetical protein
MLGVILPLPYTSSWHGASLNTDTALLFTFCRPLDIAKPLPNKTKNRGHTLTSNRIQEPRFRGIREQTLEETREGINRIMEKMHEKSHSLYSSASMPTAMVMRMRWADL